jgi:hypothetical protein
MRLETKLSGRSGPSGTGAAELRGRHQAQHRASLDDASPHSIAPTAADADDTAVHAGELGPHDGDGSGADL